LGALDENGFLKITGRKKDLLITAGGKNVAPAEMEGYMKSISGVAHAVVVGDRQPYLCALLVLDAEAIDDLVAKAGVADKDVAQLAKDPKIHEWLTTQVEEHCNTRVARYQTIKKIKVLPTDWTVESGEITPTMKIKRNVIAKRYQSEIDAFYA
ncbi:MAG: long-chain fatty acid--CoA ligase, partial [Myxococcota bacterium]